MGDPGPFGAAKQVGQQGGRWGGLRDAQRERPAQGRREQQLQPPADVLQCDALVGGGAVAPPAPQLVRIREHIATTFPKLEEIARERRFKKVLGGLDGEKLSRVPRGYPKDHPAAEYLKFKQFLGGREFPPEFATSADFYPALVETYKTLMPLIRFLNEPLAR